MRLVKISAMNLEPGMFVAEIDRPWLDTPFATQGFEVRDVDEILYVAKYVDEVYVDADYAGARDFLSLKTSPTSARPGARLALAEDLQRTKVSFESASVTLDRIFDSLRKGMETDIGAVQMAIKPLIECVFRNQEAVAVLLRLKESGDYRYHHGVAMATWAAILGRHIGLPVNELETLAVACAMCDVGMTELPNDLLEQPENLDERQQRIIRAHPKMGVELVSETKDVDMEILGVIENHHERMDGSGYPRGLQGVQIPLLARIAGLVDSYDAMITPRAYAAPRTSHEAMMELMDYKDQLFQGALVEQFVQAIGLFPSGTLVELNTGEVAIVVSQNATRRLRPEILIVLEGDKQPIESKLLVDLAVQGSQQEGERWITRELLEGTYGVHGEDFFV